ncbi:hypothetical protein KUCAC02_020689 [Chaenocephalus aceratus]|uniref:Uncharacterized protein n=1 Tax=Chaenocephalus aceratus TaxID=36190 RepID=A0ACB9XFE0_CHAAC|nr:hypothetical protein KUCAC02_020689 [Chaenocephalus aceratus]
MSDPNCLALSPGDSESLATPPALPHPPGEQQPAGRTLINPSLPAEGVGGGCINLCFLFLKVEGFASQSLFP